MGMLRRAWRFVLAILSNFIADRAMTRGAAIAYYTTFSMAPLLLLLIAVAGLVFGEEAVRGAILGELGGLMGPEGAKALEDMVQSASNTGSGIAATTISIVLLMIAATTVLAELQDALNVIWNAPPQTISGWWSLIRTRLLSLALIGAVAFLLLVSLAVSAALTAFGKYFAGETASALLEAVNFAASFLVLTGLFALVYKILPDRRLAWRDVGVGAAVTAALFTIGKFLIGLYLGTSDLASSYGAAGALILVLVWVYYSAQIFLLGAEFTKVYALGPKRSQELGAEPPSSSHPASGPPGISSRPSQGPA
jgi:membrane protein